MMDSKARAEKIFQSITLGSGGNQNSYVAPLLKNQIDEAVREARKEKCCHCDCHELIKVGDGCFTCIDQRSATKREGFAAAREKAAGIAEETEAGIKRLQEMGIQGNIVPLADRIRAMGGKMNFNELSPREKYAALLADLLHEREEFGERWVLYYDTKIDELQVVIAEKFPTGEGLIPLWAPGSPK